MTGAQVFLFVPIIIFMVVVAPIWLTMHYRSKNRARGELTDSERSEIDEMIQVANKMAARIETLEAILDVESPGWREKQSS